jgi:YfiH family protein
LYFYRESIGPVAVAFTDRRDGVSAAPYDELNLAGASEDDVDSVEENWRRLMDDFAPEARLLADMRQVHGAKVQTVEDWRGTPWGPECDGVVASSPGIVLAVRVADCVPVLLSDAESGVIGAAHAGRLGLASGVVPATLGRMLELGARDITAWIGPHVCGGCYEVPAEMRDEVAAVVPEARATTTWGTPSLDLGAGVRAQLEAAGVTVNDVSRCTRESPDLYSYRRDGRQAGRMAGLVVLR